MLIIDGLLKRKYNIIVKVKLMFMCKFMIFLLRDERVFDWEFEGSIRFFVDF